MSTTPVTKKIIAFGSKQVFLPKFTIALIRTPSLSPYHARFQVPLNFSKYDLRDYLYHAYNVKTHNIRSFVKQMPVRDTALRPRNWFREESKKFMTVEMEKPFVWPEDPEDWEPWGKKDGEEKVNEYLKLYGYSSPENKRLEAQVLREQAKSFLSGKVEEKVEGEKSLLELWEEKRTPQMLGKRAASA